MITDKKARESALKLQSYCNNHCCEQCFFYVNKNCTIHKPRIWDIPNGGIVVKLTPEELDAVITAMAYKKDALASRLQGVKDELP